MTSRTPPLTSRRAHLNAVAGARRPAPRRARAVAAYFAGLALGFCLVALISAPFGPGALPMAGAAAAATGACAIALAVTAAWARRERRLFRRSAPRRARPRSLGLAA